MAKTSLQQKTRRRRLVYSRFSISLRTKASPNSIKSLIKRSKLNISAIKHGEKENNKNKEKEKVHA